MEAHRIELIRDSFVNVLFETDRAATIFYDKLFELAPETRRLFKDDLKIQGRRLIDTLATIVTGLSRLDAMLPEIRALAVRHVGYGVVEDHYAVVEAALLHMVEQLSGPAFPPETEVAWRDAYTMLADVMVAAAREAEPPERSRATR